MDVRRKEEGGSRKYKVERRCPCPGKLVGRRKEEVNDVPELAVSASTSPTHVSCQFGGTAPAVRAFFYFLTSTFYFLHSPPVGSCLYAILCNLAPYVSPRSTTRKIPDPQNTGERWIWNRLPRQRYVDRQEIRHQSSSQTKRRVQRAPARAPTSGGSRSQEHRPHRDRRKSR